MAFQRAKVQEQKKAAARKGSCKAKTFVPAWEKLYEMNKDEEEKRC